LTSPLFLSLPHLILFPAFLLPFPSSKNGCNHENNFAHILLKMWTYFFVPNPSDTSPL
jgi:hypothetical protein